MESFLKNLKEQVTCSICLDIYNDPKLLPCLHTFCCECLSNHARASHRQGKFHCPECRATIDLPKGNRFDTLPTSFFHNSLSSVLAVRQIGDGSGITCAHCKKRSSDVHYCFDCARFMCTDCLSAHEVMKAEFEGHKVMPVKDFQDEDYKTLLKRKPFCSQRYHEREITRYFCLRCQSCICQVCTTTDHRKHKVILLDNAADKEKENIKADITLTRGKEKELKDVIRKFEETISMLEKNVTTAKRGVSQAAEQMIAKIREREREAMTSLETTRVTRLEKINSAYEKAQSLLKQLNQAFEFAQNLVQRSSSSDIMQNKKTLKQRFQELRDCVLPKHHETSFIKFTAASVEDLTMGDITIEGADVRQCTLKGLDQTLQAGVQAELILYPRTPEGEIINRPDLINQIEVLIEPAKDVTNVNVGQKENGEFKVNFTPKVPGVYSMELKIHSDKLPSCPFTMQVKERELLVNELVLKGDRYRSRANIAVNRKGTMAITSIDDSCVYIFDKEGNFLKKIGSGGKNAGQFDNIGGAAFLNDNELVVADAWNNRIQHIDIQSGIFLERGTAKREFGGPFDVCLDEQHHIVVTEYCKGRIQVITQEGETISIFGDSGPEKLYRPTSCIPYKDMFFICDAGSNSIKVYDQSGTFLYKFREDEDGNGVLNYPHGILVDITNNVLVCDYYRDEVLQFSLDGRFTGRTVGVSLGMPIGIATSPDGRILVTCVSNIIVLK